MALRNFLKLSAIASALVLAGCGGGDINIESHPGHGTKVCVKLLRANSVQNPQIFSRQEEFKT